MNTLFKTIGTLCRSSFSICVAVLSFLSVQVAFNSAFGQQGQDVLKISVIPHRSHLGNEEAYTRVFEELERRIGMKVQFIGSVSYSEVVEKLGEKSIDAAYVGPFAYITAKKMHGVRLLVRTLDENNEEFYKSMIIARKDSGITSLNDLKGKSFAFTDPQSTSGFLFPLTALKKAGIQLSDFSRVEYVKRHANSLLAVYSRQMDAGAISSTAPAKVDVDFDQIGVLWESAPIYRGPWVVRSDLPDETFRKVRDALLEIGRDENREKIFETLSTKGFVPGKDSDYDNVREAESLKDELNIVE